MIEVMIFDMDGVVVNSEVGITRCINQTLVHHNGWPIDEEWYKNNHFGTHDDFVLSRGVSRDVFPQFGEMLRRLFDEMDECEEREGIREIFSWVKDQGLPLHISSACRAEHTKRKLSHCPGLIDFVDQIHEGERKRETFHLIMRELQLAPYQIGFITDMARDIEEAHYAGVTKVAAITSGFSTEEQLLKYGCPVFHHHGALLNYLKTWR